LHFNFILNKLKNMETTKEEGRKLYLREYMRTYLKKKYEEDPTKYRGKVKTQKIKDDHPELYLKYGYNLHDYLKVKGILSLLPKEIVIDLFKECL